MMTIFEAKKHLQDRYRFEEGFVGVGICHYANEDALRIYVADAHFPIVQQLKGNAKFEGFPVVVEVSGKIQAFSA
ncbi:hypothetical protein IH992_11520 [Candidatus Poribacteria bacterium]|nr:hypothetical protein [Candidatus Poribacteria bacterium]